jgi:two-component system chemotaxis response regulator CheB
MRPDRRPDVARPESHHVPVSVLIVDDSTVVRRIVTTALGEDPEVRVVGTAANGHIALAKLDLLAPDVVTLDVEMPVMDGLTALREIRKTRPDIPVIMFSTLTERGASATLEALSLGASDYVTKPANVGSVLESVRAVREQLIPRIKALHAARHPVTRPAASGPTAQTAPGASTLRSAPRSASGRVDVVAIGCSTGGPEALARLVPLLPAALPVPVVVVQHMPPVFTRMLANRLDGLSAVSVTEALDGQSLTPGTVYLAPGGRHLTVARQGTAVRAVLTDDPPENFCRPAVDVLFRSVAAAYGGGSLALVLTGMGSDGMRGAEPIKAAGGTVVVQDRATSVVWGMPGAVAGAGLADEVVPIEEMADSVARHLARRGADAHLTGATS